MFCDVVEVSDYTPGRLHHPQSTIRCDQDMFSVSSYHHIFGCRARTSHVVGAPQFAAWYIRSRFILSFYPTSVWGVRVRIRNDECCISASLVTLRIYKILGDPEISNHKADEYLQLCTVQLHVMN